MSVLVIAEHDSQTLKAATLNVVTAAGQLGDVVVLVAGEGCKGVAEAAAKVDGVSKVLLADSPVYAHPLAESVAPLVVGLASGYSHLLAPATNRFSVVDILATPRGAAAVAVLPQGAGMVVVGGSAERSAEILRLK